MAIANMNNIQQPLQLSGDEMIHVEETNNQQSQTKQSIDNQQLVDTYEISDQASAVISLQQQLSEVRAKSKLAYLSFQSTMPPINKTTEKVEETIENVEQMIENVEETIENVEVEPTKKKEICTEIIEHCDKLKGTKTDKSSECSEKRLQNKSSKRVHILSDSKYRLVTGYDFSSKLRNCHVSVKSISGAKTGCMDDYVNPSIREKPDHIVLHVGTNNLPLHSTKKIAEDIIKLGKRLKEEKIDVTVSSILFRNDKFNEKANEVNQLLKKLCIENNLYFIDHSNKIKNSHINQSKVHLNKRGLSILVSTVASHLSNILQ